MKRCRFKFEGVHRFFMGALLCVLGLFIGTGVLYREHHRQPWLATYLVVGGLRVVPKWTSEHMMDTRKFSVSMTRDLLSSLSSPVLVDALKKSGMTEDEFSEAVSAMLHGLILAQFLPGTEESTDSPRDKFLKIILPSLLGMAPELFKDLSETNWSSLLTVGSCETLGERAVCSVILQGSSSDPAKEIVLFWERQSNLVLCWQLVGLHGLGNILKTSSKSQ